MNGQQIGAPQPQAQGAPCWGQPSPPPPTQPQPPCACLPPVPSVPEPRVVLPPY